MKLVDHRCTRWFFHDVKFSSLYLQNSANIFGKSRSTFLKYKTKRWEIKRTHLSSKRSIVYLLRDPNMSIILCMSFCIVLFAYFLSMLITAKLLSLSCPIVNLKNVLMRRRALKDLSAEHEVVGIVARMEETLYRTSKMSWRPFWCMVFTITAAFFLWHGSTQS